MARSIWSHLATAAALLALKATSAGASSYNGLAVTPQMGWDNWNAFGCKVDEELLLNTAQKMVDFGLRDLGQLSPHPLPKSAIQMLMKFVSKATTMSYWTTAGQMAEHRMVLYKPMQQNFPTECAMLRINFTRWDWDSACTRVLANILVHGMQRH